MTPPIYKVVITKACWNKLSGTELNSDHAIKKVAKPPKPLNKATISGIDVIFTLRAIREPTTAPNAIPLKSIIGLTTSIKVMLTAINIAKAEKKLPLTAVSSLPNIFMPVINNIDEKM